MAFRRLAFVVFLFPSVASAQDAWSPRPAPAGPFHQTPTVAAEPRLSTSPLGAATSWYGWQILIADGSSLVVGLTGGIMDLKRTTTVSHALLYTGLLGYALASPLVHWGHEQIGTGFESLGLRLGLPLGGMITGYGLGYAFGDRCFTGDEGDNGSLACLPFVMSGLVAGMVAAAIIDTAYLAREPVPATFGGRGPLQSLGLAPLFANHERGVLLRAAF